MLKIQDWKLETTILDMFRNNKVEFNPNHEYVLYIAKLKI